MTDRVFALTVVLEKNTRDDDARPILDAIQMIKGVLSVEAHVTDMGQWAAEARVRQKFTEQLWGVLYPEIGSATTKR